jgi:hypothetical protein
MSGTRSTPHKQRKNQRSCPPRTLTEATLLAYRDLAVTGWWSPALKRCAVLAEGAS